MLVNGSLTTDSTCECRTEMIHPRIPILLHIMGIDFSVRDTLRFTRAHWDLPATGDFTTDGIAFHTRGARRGGWEEEDARQGAPAGTAPRPGSPLTVGGPYVPGSGPCRGPPFPAPGAVPRRAAPRRVGVRPWRPAPRRVLALGDKHLYP